MSRSKRPKKRSARQQAPGTLPEHLGGRDDGPGFNPEAWAASRAGARAGRGFHYQDAVGAYIAAAVHVGAFLPMAIIPEGLDDLSFHMASSFAHAQAKSRHTHRGPMPKGEALSVLAEGWDRHGEGLLTDAKARFTLVVEQPVEGIEETGWNGTLANQQGIDDLFIAQTRKYKWLTTKIVAKLAARTRLVVAPNPTEDAVSLLAHHIGLPKGGCLPHVLALRAAIANAADANMTASATNPKMLTVTDIAAIVEATTANVDRDALTEALRIGICEVVDFGRPLEDPRFYEGVDVLPGHVAAGLTTPRPALVAEAIASLDAGRPVLVAAPSGAGKSAIVWMTAYETRHARWHRVQRLDEEHVDSLIRFARSSGASPNAPIGFVVDNVGQARTSGWDRFVSEVKHLPGVWILGAARIEDLFTLTTLPGVDLVRPELSEELAESLYGDLGDRNSTNWPHWREPFEMSEGLLLEYTHLLTQGRRLQDVIDSQVTARVREGRDLELQILAIVATAAAWGSTVPTNGLVDHLGVDSATVNGALRRLIEEHLVVKRAGDTLGGLHRLRSTQLVHSLHATPPPLIASSVKTVVSLVDLTGIKPFLIGILGERVIADDDALKAAAQRALEDPSPAAVTAVLHALRLADFGRLAETWIAIADEEGVPINLRPIAANLALLDRDHTLDDLLDPRLVAAIRRMRALSPLAHLRHQVLEILGPHWILTRLANSSPREATGLLAALADTSDFLTIQPSLGVANDSLLMRELPDAKIADLTRLLASARSASVDLANQLAASLGSEEVRLGWVEETVPWLRDATFADAGDLDLPDGIDIEPDAICVSCNYRHVSDEQGDARQAAIDAAKIVLAVLPDVQLVKIQALDPLNELAGYGDYHIADLSLHRSVLYAESEVAWNRARLRAYASMTSTMSSSARLQRLIRLLERSASLLAAVTRIWIRGESGTDVRGLDRERSGILAELAILPLPPADSSDETGPLDLGSVDLTDPVSSLIDSTVNNMLGRLADPGAARAALAGFVRATIVNDLSKAAEPDRWRLIGLDNPPPSVDTIREMVTDLGDILAEIAWGKLGWNQLQKRARAGKPSQGLVKAASLARAAAEARLVRQTDKVTQAVTRLGYPSKILRRPAPDPSVWWPPQELALTVELPSLLQLEECVQVLLTEASHLPGSKITLIPLREGMCVPTYGGQIHSGKYWPLNDNAPTWEGEIGLPVLEERAAAVFRTLTTAIGTASGILAISKQGRIHEVEHTLLESAIGDVETARAELDSFATGSSDPLLMEVMNIVMTYGEVLESELIAATSGSPLADPISAHFIAGIKGNPDEVFNTLVGAQLLLTEWDIDPEEANRRLTEFSVPPLEPTSNGLEGERSNDR